MAWRGYATAFGILLASSGEPVRSAPVVTIAHRGASAYAPEHTLLAYDLALAQGADYIEQDVQITRDGVLVCLHDATLDRTARGDPAYCSGPVRDRTLAEIRSCDVGRWFNEAYPERARPEYEGLRIPTLASVFARYGPRANYYVEIKSSRPEDRMEERLLALLRRYRLRGAAVRRWQVVIQSFDATSLRILHARDPALPLVQLVLGFAPGPALENALDGIAAYAVGIGPSAAFTTPALLEAARARCLAVHPYTVDAPDEMARLLALGAQGLFTNAPDRLETVLGRAALERRQAGRRASRARLRCLRSR